MAEVRTRNLHVPNMIPAIWNGEVPRPSEILMSEAPFELMYRRPGNRRHEAITDVLDDILVRLEELEDAVDRLYMKTTILVR